MGFFRFMFGVALGLGVGYLAGRLYAPSTGVALQAELRSRYQYVRDEAQRAADERRREMEERYRSAKRSGVARI